MHIEAVYIQKGTLLCSSSTREIIPLFHSNNTIDRHIKLLLSIFHPEISAAILINLLAFVFSRITSGMAGMFLISSSS